MTCASTGTLTTRWFVKGVETSMKDEPTRLCEQLPWDWLTTREQLFACGRCDALAICRAEAFRDEAELPLRYIEGTKGGLTARQRRHKQQVIRGSRKERTHCKQGHEWSEENTRWVTSKSGSSYRRCKECERIKSRKYNQKRRKKKNGTYGV